MYHAVKVEKYKSLHLTKPGELHAKMLKAIKLCYRTSWTNTIVLLHHSQHNDYSRLNLFSITHSQ